MGEFVVRVRLTREENASTCAVTAGGDVGNRYAVRKYVAMQRCKEAMRV